MKKPLIDQVKYELRKYEDLKNRMDDLMHESGLKADYNAAKEAEIKRNCYNMIVSDLKKLANFSATGSK